MLEDRGQLVDILPSIKKLPNIGRALCSEQEVVIASNKQTVAAPFQKLLGGV